MNEIQTVNCDGVVKAVELKGHGLLDSSTLFNLCAGIGAPIVALMSVSEAMPLVNNAIGEQITPVVLGAWGATIFGLSYAYSKVMSEQFYEEFYVVGAAAGLLGLLGYSSNIHLEYRGDLVPRYESAVPARNAAMETVKRTPMEISLPPGLQFKPNSPN